MEVTDAERLARLSELPDTNVHGSHEHKASSQNYTWAVPEYQKLIHSLLGSKASVQKNINYAKERLLEAQSEEDLSHALHYFGDAPLRKE